MSAELITVTKGFNGKHHLLLAEGDNPFLHANCGSTLNLSNGKHNNSLWVSGRFGTTSREEALAQARAKFGERELCSKCSSN
jgi:hypothetical protein